MEPDTQEKLKQKVADDVQRMEKAEQNKKTILAQTAYLGTVGVVFILPVIVGAYLGVWLDGRLNIFSFSWTISLIFLGVVIGAVNIYLLIRD